MISAFSIDDLRSGVLVVNATAVAMISSITAQQCSDSVWRGEIVIEPEELEIPIDGRCMLIISQLHTYICYNVILLHIESSKTITSIPANTTLIALIEFKSMRLL